MNERDRRLLELKDVVKEYFDVTGVGVGGWEAGFDAVRHHDVMAESFVLDLRRLVTYIENEYEYADEEEVTEAVPAPSKTPPPLPPPPDEEPQAARPARSAAPGVAPAASRTTAKPPAATANTPAPPSKASRSSHPPMARTPGGAASGESQTSRPGSSSKRRPSALSKPFKARGASRGGGARTGARVSEPRLDDPTEKTPLPPSGRRRS